MAVIDEHPVISGSPATVRCSQEQLRFSQQLIPLSSGRQPSRTGRERQGELQGGFAVIEVSPSRSCRSSSTSAYGPTSEVATRLFEVSSSRRSGLDLLTLSSSRFDPKATLVLWAAMPKPILDLWLICAEMPTLRRGGRTVTVRQPQASGGF